MGYTAQKVGTLFQNSVEFRTYFLSVIDVSTITGYPWDFGIYSSTDHSSLGGIYAGGLKTGTSGSVAANYEHYNAAVARGAFDSFGTKPAANPIYTDAMIGYDSVETPDIMKVGANFEMLAQTAVAGNDHQPTFKTSSTDMLNFVNHDRGDGEAFVIAFDTHDKYPHSNYHRGYFRRGTNIFPDVPYVYVGYGLYGGGANGPNNMMYGSNDGTTWVELGLVTEVGFTDGSTPNDFGMWWNSLDPKSIRDAGGGEFVALCTFGTFAAGGAARVTKIYEVYIAGDGRTITRSPRLVIDTGGVGADDEDECSHPVLYDHNGTLLLFYQGADATADNHTMLATVTYDPDEPKPARVIRPNHTKHVLSYEDGDVTADFIRGGGFAAFDTDHILFENGESIQLSTTVQPTVATWFECYMTMVPGGAAGVSPFISVGDLVTRPDNGVEYVTYSTVYLLGKNLGADAGIGEPRVPVQQNDLLNHFGIRWDVTNQKLSYLGGDEQALLTIDVTANTALPLRPTFGSAAGSVKVDTLTFRVGTTGLGIAPTVLTAEADNTVVTFTLSDPCIGDGTGIEIRDGGVPVVGTWARPSETVATFTRTSGSFVGTIVYDLDETDLRLKQDLVAIQDAVSQPIDFDGETIMNTLGIQERTLAQISEATNTINLVDATGAVTASPRKSVYQPIVCRVTDHQDDDNAATDDADKMAIFKCPRLGQPWTKDANVLEHVIVQADADPVTNPTATNVSVLYPNFDYSTF